MNYSTIKSLTGSIQRSKQCLENTEQELQNTLQDIRRLITEIVVHQQVIAAMERDINILKNA
jgi:hypothetical protein